MSSGRHDPHATGRQPVREIRRGKPLQLEDYWRRENALYMRGSAGQPEEVAEVVYFLASDASSFCTGSHYLVDGGLVAG